VAHCSLSLTGASGGVLDEHLAFDVPLVDLARAQAEAQRGLWLASAVVLALGAIAAWFLAGSLVGPLAQLTEAAQRIAAGDLERPVTVRTNDEIGTLAVASADARAGRLGDGRARDERC
jgi:HAMP domain-containing protein